MTIVQRVRHCLSGGKLHRGIESEMAQWTFLTNHALVLRWLARHPRITALEIAAQIGITERQTRKIIADLDAAGYIEKKRQGRRVKYRINPDTPMRHETQQDMAVGDFLEAMGWTRRSKRKKPGA